MDDRPRTTDDRGGGAAHRRQVRRTGGAALARAVRELYGAGQTDYSIEPIVLVDAQGEPIGRIKDGDAVVFCCRRGEREIQLTEAFVERERDLFPRRDFRNLTFAILTLYHEKFKDLPVAFAPTKIGDTLAEIVSRAGLRQMHVAESEKFAHVTFFFNGGSNRPLAGEEDVRVPSPTGVAFDLVPELSAAQVAEQIVRGVREERDLIVANFANGDVIGHTQNREAKIRCAELMDARLRQVTDAALAGDYVVMITADHGNLEVMTHPDGTPHVSHTANPVPFLLLDGRAEWQGAVRDGKLADVAPTVLEAMGIYPPASLRLSHRQPPLIAEGQSEYGECLVHGHDWGGRRRVLLLILDGWGLGSEDATNPIWLAETPVWDRLLRECPHAQMEASGEAVGLKEGKPGNSEAGHMNLGAGRIVLQDDTRLDQAMQDGSFYRNETLCSAIDEARQRKSSLHLIGLLTEKSSHGTIDYPLALLRMARERGLDQVYLHIIFDGRSTQPGSAPEMLDRLDRQVEEIGTGQIVTGVGRGIALDRGGNYDKTRRAYDALVFGTGRRAAL